MVGFDLCLGKLTEKAMADGEFECVREHVKFWEGFALGDKWRWYICRSNAQCIVQECDTLSQLCTASALLRLAEVTVRSQCTS